MWRTVRVKIRQTGILGHILVCVASKYSALFPCSLAFRCNRARIQIHCIEDPAGSGLMVSARHLTLHRARSGASDIGHPNFRTLDRGSVGRPADEGDVDKRLDAILVGEVFELACETERFASGICDGTSSSIVFST